MIRIRVERDSRSFLTTLYFMASMSCVGHEVRVNSYFDDQPGSFIPGSLAPQGVSVLEREPIWPALRCLALEGV